MKEKTDKAFVVRLLVFNKFSKEKGEEVESLLKRIKETNNIEEKRSFLKQVDEIIDMIEYERRRFKKEEGRNLMKLEKWLEINSE